MKKIHVPILLIAMVLSSQVAIAQNSEAVSMHFSYDKARLAMEKPWTDQPFGNNPEQFQFVVIGDRTGGANQEHTFKIAMDQLNLLQPEFVINVGDTIERGLSRANRRKSNFSSSDMTDTIIRAFNTANTASIFQISTVFDDEALIF